MTMPIENTTQPLAISGNALASLWEQSTAWLFSHIFLIAIAVGAAVVLVALMLAVRTLGDRLCRRRQSLTHWPVTIGRVITATRLWFMVLFAAKLVDGYASPPPLLAQTVSVLFTIAAALQGALWVREFILGIIEHRAGTDVGALGSAIGIVRLLVTVALFAIAIVLILDNLGVNVTGLVAGLGIGGIAIGLAAKGIFDDLFSALSIIFDRPFARGDSIQWDDTSGTVETIGLKTTRVRASTGELVVISNTNLLNKELHNMARLDHRRVELVLGLLYRMPAATLLRVPTIVKDVVNGQANCVFVRCGIVELTQPDIEVKLEFDVRSPDWDGVFNARHTVAVAILDAFAKEGIELAGPDGKSVTPPVVPPPEGAAGA